MRRSAQCDRDALEQLAPEVVHQVEHLACGAQDGMVNDRKQEAVDGKDSKGAARTVMVPTFEES
jgi:hypothetical protein